MYNIILPHLKQRRKISSDTSPLLYVLYQPIISMEIDDDIKAVIFFSQTYFQYVLSAVHTAFQSYNPLHSTILEI